MGRHPQSGLDSSRAHFNRAEAPQLGQLVDPGARAVALGPSARFAYFESDSTFIVVAGSQEDSATQLALVYGLSLRRDLELVLVLPKEHIAQSALRAAWLDIPIRIFGHRKGQVAAHTVPDRVTALNTFGTSSFVDRVHHLGDRAPWVEPLTSWAGAHDYLSPAHRPDNRSWHCMGLRVLRVSRTDGGVHVRAGISYTDGEGKPGAAITLELAAPITDEQLEICQDVIEAAIDERYFEGGSMYVPDEHWLQAVLRDSPALVGIEQPALREVAALRCTGTSPAGKPNWSRGFIDLLGADPHATLRLIETKLGTYDLLVLQGLDYLIWAERHREQLTNKLSLPSDAPIELHFVVGGKGGAEPSLSRWIPAQLDALASDIDWRLHYVEDWFDSVPDVREVHRSDGVARTHKSLHRPTPSLPFEAKKSAWNHPRFRVPSDSSRTARYRALQSWYREQHLDLPPGRNASGHVIASLLPEDEVARDPGLNFITTEAKRYASERCREIINEGGAVDLDRLRRNMLSSMPLCFNVFGALSASPTLPELLRAAFDIPVATVDWVECEWAPERHLHLNDRTAFDAVVTYTSDDGAKCFLGVETKYTEPFSHKEYDSEQYQKVTATSGYFREGAGERLVGRGTNQLWRMSMLAASLIVHEDYERGSICVLALNDDARGRNAVRDVSAELTVENFVTFVALEDVARAARAISGLDSWAEAFTTRYLDLTPVVGDG